MKKKSFTNWKIATTEVKRLRYFKEGEFGDWSFEQISPCLLVLFDALRGVWRDPLIVSPADGAVGRIIRNPEDKGYNSEHNYVKNGRNYVNAVDVFPMRDGSPPTKGQMSLLYDFAKDIGFTGIGLYDWTTLNGQDKHYMIHLDLRDKPLNWYSPDRGGYLYGQAELFFKE